MMPGGYSDNRQGTWQSNAMGWRPWEVQCVEETRSIRPDDQVCGRKTLHINAKKVKFHRTLVISSKMTNGKQILNNVGSKKNVVEIEWAQNDRVT
jgi:hypothetical protein